MKSNKLCPIGTEIQSVIFSKDKFTEKSAKSWAESNDFKYGKVDEKKYTYRMRQESPSEYRKGSFRTIEITDGVKAVIGCPIDTTSKKMKKPKFADGGETRDTRVASEILKQLGGMNRLSVMTGAYSFVAYPNGVSFRIKNPKANYIKIILTSMDLYDLEVGRIRGLKYTVVADEKGLYGNMLKPAIENATGMYLTLYSSGGSVGRRYKLSAEKYTKLIDYGLWVSKKSDIIGNYNIYSKDGDKLVAVWSLPKERLTLRGDFQNILEWINSNGVEEFSNGGVTKEWYETRNGKHLYKNRDAIWYLSYGTYKLGEDGKEYSTLDKEVRVYRKNSGLSEIKHYRKDKNYRVIDERSSNGELYYIAFLDLSDNVSTIVFSIGDLYANGGEINGVKIKDAHWFSGDSENKNEQENKFQLKEIFLSSNRKNDSFRIHRKSKLYNGNNYLLVDLGKGIGWSVLEYNPKKRKVVNVMVYGYGAGSKDTALFIVDYRDPYDPNKRRLMLAKGGSLNKIYRFDEFGDKSFKNIIDEGRFVSKFKSKQNAIDFDRIKFNRMDNAQQVEYVKKFNKEKIVYNLRLRDGGLHEVSKEVYDYAQLPETEEKNYYTKYEDGGGVRNYSEAEKWWGNDLSLNEQKEYAKKHLASYEYDELLGTTSQYSKRERRQKFINKIWEKHGSPKSVLNGLYSDGGVIAPSRYDFRRPKFESPVDTLLIDGYKTAPTKSMVYGDLDKVKSRFREESEYAKFSPVVAVVYPYQRGWDRGYKIYYSTDKEVPMGFVDEINGKRYVYHIGGNKMEDGGVIDGDWVILVIKDGDESKFENSKLYLEDGKIKTFSTKEEADKYGLNFGFERDFWAYQVISKEEINKRGYKIENNQFSKMADGGVISTDYKSAISDLIEYYRNKSKFKLEKYAVLTQEQGEYLYNAFKNYESLKNEDGEYVAEVKYAYNGHNFEETKEQDEALTKFLKELEETDFIYFDEYDSAIQAYPITIEFINAVRGRVSTLKAKQSGTDLFPEMDGDLKQVDNNVRQIDLPDTNVDKIYTVFFENKVMEDYFGDELQTFWDKNKVKWSDEYVSKLRAEGFSDKDIFSTLFGYTSIHELKCEREFELNGLLSKINGSQNRIIDEIISAKKSGYYMAGLKYPMPLNILIDQLFAKYKINEEPLIYDVDTSSGIGDEKIYIYKGDGIYIGKTVYTDREKSPIDKYDALNGGYVGVVADSSEKLYDAISILFNDEESYLKDLNLFYNGLGGIDANDIVNAFGEAKPLVVEDVKPVSLGISKEPTREEIEEAIKGLQVMVELEPENNTYIEAIDGLKIYLETITEEENTQVTVPVIEETKGEIGDYYDLRLPLGEKVGISESISRRIRDLFVRKEGKVNKRIMDNTISAMSERTPQYANAWKNFKKTFDIEEVDGNYINPYYEYGGDVKDVLVGGKADGMMLDDIASMHGVALDHILRQAKIGISVEREHTSDYNKIIEIVKDHLYESPDYYTKLQKIESSFESGGGVGGYYIDVPKEHKSIFTMKALMEIRGMQINSGVEQVDGTFRFTFLNESDLDKAVAILNIIQRPDYGRDMPQNLSQLKKYIQVGKLLRVSYNKNRPDWVGKIKVVVQVQTNGFYMMDGVEVPDDISKKSWIEYPKSDMVAFSPFWFSIYAKDKQGNKVKMLQYEYVIGEQEKIAKSVEKDETLLFNEAVKMNEFVDSVYRLSDSVEFGKGGSLTPDMFDNNLDYNFDNQSVSCFINAKNTGRTLVLRRSGSDYSGTWSLMSGGIDAGESPDETIKREIQEELGVNLNCDNLIFMNATKHPDRTHYYYEMSVNEEFEPVLNHENDAYMWVNMAELPDNTHPLLKKYIKSEVFA